MLERATFHVIILFLFFIIGSLLGSGGGIYGGMRIVYIMVLVYSI
jgi:hypothetical protein